MEAKELQKFFEENQFNVDEYYQENIQCAEIEQWTDGGVDMIISLQPFKAQEFIKWVDDFDIDEEIMLHRQDPSYCSAFTIRASLEDFEGFLKKMTVIKEKLNKLIV